ncbi:iron-containing alcohol dehydrogenase [Lichenicoccus sp.]|uniref:iron-containing alcohol dehydrogenase n=1 Tax=Lichenicoccus sp. TaxID=2781899 RepID=UPI003D115FE8
MSSISYLTRIEFEHGAVRRLPALLDELKVARPLIVTDRGLAATGIVKRVAGLFDAAPPVFDATPANPTEAAVLQARALYRETGCDGLVGLGGGSSIDLAKAVRLLSGHEGPLALFTAVAGGAARIHGRICPMVAVPTTAGTGSEVGRAAVIVTAEGRKLGLVSPFMVPSVALCDPELTLGLPPLLTAATGMDAISHCLETYMSPAINPPADAIALDGLRRGIAAIRAATRDGSDRTARWEMMMCALQGALAFQKGLGAVHALTHPMGAIPGLTLHHGTLNAILMPAVLRFNRTAIGGKWAVLADILGGTPDQVIATLCAELGLPGGLRALGVTETMMQHIAGEALRDHCHATNPRTASRDDYLDLLRAAA